jgi:hypothetical protein
LYTQATGLQNQLRALILQAVPIDYIEILEDAIRGFATVTPAKILAHLTTTYGQITPKALAANLKTASTTWDPDTPIERVFTTGNKCRQFATAGNDPISDTAYVRIIVEVFTKSGVLTKALEDWDDMPVADQTIANMVSHFTKADDNRRDRQKGLKETLTNNTAITSPGSSPVQVTGMAYCWSHGLGFTASPLTHTSANCKWPATGHCKDATIQNMMGGRVTLNRPPGFKTVWKYEGDSPGGTNNTRSRNRNRNRTTTAATTNTPAAATTAATPSAPTNTAAPPNA